MDRRYFSVAEAAKYSTLSRSKLYELMTAGELESARIGGRRIIPKDAIDAMIAGRIKRGIK